MLCSSKISCSKPAEGVEVEEADDELGEELEDEGALDVLEELEDQEEEVADRTVDGDHAGGADDEGLPFPLAGVVLRVEDTSLDGPFWLGAEDENVGAEDAGAEDTGAEDVASVED